MGTQERGVQHGTSNSTPVSYAPLPKTSEAGAFRRGSSPHRAASRAPGGAKPCLHLRTNAPKSSLRLSRAFRLQGCPVVAGKPRRGRRLVHSPESLCSSHLSPPILRFHL